MNRLAKSAILSAAVAATTLVPIVEAAAGERWRQQRPRHPAPVTYQDRHDQLLAAGIVGLAVGALVVGAISAAENNSGPVHRPAQGYDPYASGYGRHGYPAAARRIHRQPAYREPVVVMADDYGAAQPWTPEWFDYCEGRYRSFNAQTGTFRGYDGQDHFCVAP